MSLVRDLIRDYRSDNGVGSGSRDGDFRLDIPRWEIADSGVTALWGPSGAGKTSVFRCLLGLEPVPSMSWDFQGVDIAKLSVSERRLGVVFQNYELFPHMTAAENIMFAAQSRRISSDEFRAKIKELVVTLNLESCFERRASLLSGGERQRVALARALIGKPRMLLLDEPFAALDSDLRASARSLVKSVVSAAGIPVILITHDRADLDALANHVVEIRDGKLV